MMTRRASTEAAIVAAVLNFLAGRKLLSHAETLIKNGEKGNKRGEQSLGYSTAPFLFELCIV